MKSLRRPDLLHLCTEAYRLDVDEQVWLENVAGVMAEMFDDEGEPGC